jgi:hypothetical protein
MTSQFFEKIVQLVQETMGVENANSLIEAQCKQIGMSPDELRSEHGGLLVMKLMSDLGESLPREDWLDLDDKFKKLLKENIVHRTKVKGFILMGIQDYISLKGGRIALDQIKQKTNLPDRVRVDSWYPLAVLEELLIGADEVTHQEGRTRSRAMGKYVVSPKVLRNARYWFGNVQITTKQALRNMGEILSLDQFSIKRKEDQLVLSFNGSTYMHFQEFMMGICEGIFEIRDLPFSKMELMEGHKDSNEISIEITYTEKEDTQ